MRKEKRWYQDYWEDGRFKRVRITEVRFTLDFLCCNSLLLFFFFFYEKSTSHNLSYHVCRTFILSFFVQLIIHNCCSFPLYLGLNLRLQIWAKFTGVDPKFVRRKTIREKRQIFSPYLSFRPSVLTLSHLENVDFCEILDGGLARFWWNYVHQLTFGRIGQN